LAAGQWKKPLEVASIVVRIRGKEENRGVNGKYRPAFLAVLTLAALFGTICGILALLGVFARPATPAVSVFAAGERLSGFRFELIPPRGCRLEAGVPVVTEEALLQEILPS
jgi:hypothetical protein